MAEPNKKFIIYKASAGSGKTYTLVKEYLKIVLTNPAKYRNILAVTFTNKAAYEMKSRVVAFLTMLSAINDEPAGNKKKETEKYGKMISELSAATGLDVSELSVNAKIVLQRILHNYSDFAISTIDSFVQKIIRTFAYDLKLSQSFQVELDSKRILSEAVDVMISCAGSDDDVTKMLIEFIKQKMDDGENWDIEKDLKVFSEQLLKEDTQKYIGLFSSMSLTDFGKAISGALMRRKVTDHKAVAIAQGILKTIESNNIGFKSFFQGTKGIPGFFMRIANGGLGAASTNSYCDKAINDDVWYSKTLEESEKNKIDSIKDRIAEVYLSIIPMIREYLDLTLLIKSLYPLSLLSRIEKETQTIKDEENIVFISDFYRKIHEQLLNEPVPFIYQRAGEKYEHFFIDEFQDTSVLQFQNMLPLIDNSLASGYANLIVGDGKQAIYRWRNGEVMQFVQLPGIYHKPAFPHFDEIEKTIGRNIIEYHDYEAGVENINYRSKSEIVNFNNVLFGFLADEILAGDKKGIYQCSDQKAKPGNEGGFVQIRFFEKGTDYSENQLNYITEKISGLIQKGCFLKDIAVVCRANQQAADIASHLLRNGIDVVSAESLLLRSSPKVNFLMSVFRYLNDPGDELAAAFILFYLQKNFYKDVTLNSLINKYNKVKKNHNRYPLQRILDEFKTGLNVEKIALMPLYDLSESLIRTFGFNATADPFIIYFIDAVNEFVCGNTPGLQDFIVWWDEKGSEKSIVVPDMLDAVKVLTIHKAKGLEFPVVIYPFADETVNTRGATAWVENDSDKCPEIKAFPVNLTQKGLAGTSFEDYYEQEKNSAELDMLNICYVALTRAENQLYILSKKYEKDGSSFGSMLKKYLISIDKWDEDTDVYEFGVPPVPEGHKEKKKESNVMIPDKIISTDWPGKMVIKYNSSILWQDDETAKRISWGKIIHRVLSEIRQREDTPDAVRKMVFEGLIGNTEAEKINKYINELLDHPDFKKFFQPGLHVLTEAEILTPANEVYRPDRIIFEKEKNIVIDFKTGAETDSHKTQISNYADLLTGINGKPCEKYLVYLRKELLFEKV
ncbi:MAG TPA: UvrD-helicase domain-containing protein [Bacteroidales bacterium]|nr:UvrD-helicase domain-containing protein [Bacteroidales bacterium]